MAEEPNPPAAPAAPAPAAPAAPTEPSAGGPVQLPDDHPLVTAFHAQKAELADFRKAKADAEDAAKSADQKQAERIAALEAKNLALESDALRNAVAADKKLTTAQAKRLVGTTREELEADADALLAEFTGGTPAPQLPGNRRPAGPVSQVQEHEETREDRKKRLAESYNR
jgi:hypothetical protein